EALRVRVGGAGVQQHRVADRGHALDVGLAEAVGRVDLARPRVLQAEPLTQLPDQRPLTERAQRDDASVDPAVEEDEGRTFERGPGNGLLALRELRVEL